MPPARKKPQDHKPAKDALFTFTGADGKTYTLPLASNGTEKMTGRQMRDAVMDGGGLGELKLGYAMLEACGAPVAAVDAIYDLPNEETLKILGAWLSHGDGEGTSVPQSSGSST